MIRHNGIEIDRRRRVIRHEGAEMYFQSRTRFRLVSSLILADMPNVDDLFLFIYGARADGGTEYGTKQVNVFLSQIRKMVLLLGLEIITGRHSSSKNLYALVPIGTLYPGWWVYGTDARARSLQALARVVP